MPTVIEETTNYSQGGKKVWQKVQRGHGGGGKVGGKNQKKGNRGKRKTPITEGKPHAKKEKKLRRIQRQDGRSAKEKGGRGEKPKPRNRTLTNFNHFPGERGERTGRGGKAKGEKLKLGTLGQNS